MATPDFVLELRKSIGHAPLWLGGVTAVIVRGDALLLVKRSDTGEWSPITGIIDPGEEPAVTAVREASEEAGVVITADRLIAVEAEEELVYANGDVAHFLSVTFRCSWVSGEPIVGDDENTDAAWFSLAALPPLAARYAHRVELALANRPEAHFRS